MLSSRAECAELLRENLSAANDWAAAVRSAAEAAKLWETSLSLELDAQSGSTHAAEAAVETLCAIGGACMAFGTLALSRDNGELDAKLRRAAQAAVKRALDAFEEAVTLCDSARGDDLADVLQRWARALWGAADVVPSAKRIGLLKLAIEKAAASMRFSLVPLPETACLLGDLLIELGESTWRQRVETDDARDEAAAAALWLHRRALHEGYAAATRVSQHDLSTLCALADALLDSARLQHDMAARGVDVAAQAAAQPNVTADATQQPPPPLVQPQEEEGVVDVTDAAAAPTEAGADEEDELADAVDAMQVEPPLVPQVIETPTLPPLPLATACLERATGLYSDVLGRPAAEWAAASVSRNDAAYNAACAWALRAEEAECAKLLGVLAAEGALTRSELESDADLASFVPTAWMQELMGRLPP